MFYFVSVECVKGVCVSMKREITSLFLLGVVTLSVVGCGNNEKNQAVAQYQEMGMTESEAQEVADAVYGEDAGTVADASTEADQEVLEITFEPTEEIKNATLYEPVVQVYDDVFVLYSCTVDEFIAQFGDKYDFSAIDPDTFENMNYFEVQRKDAPGYALRVWCDGSGDHLRIGDRYVRMVDAPNCRQFVWLPGAISCDTNNTESSGYNYETFVSEYLAGMGITVEDDKGAENSNLVMAVNGEMNESASVYGYTKSIKIGNGPKDYNGYVVWVVLQPNYLKAYHGAFPTIEEIDHEKKFDVDAIKYEFIEDEATGEIICGQYAYNGGISSEIFMRSNVNTPEWLEKMYTE